MHSTNQVAKTGDIESLQRMMLSPDFQWKPDTTATAACHGQLEFLKFAHEHGCHWDLHTCVSAAYGGRLDCLKFAHEHGAPLTSHTTNIAVLNSHLECLKYAYEKGCPVDEFHSYTAASRSLECLQYLHSIRCPMDVYTAIHAAFEYKLDCLRFVIENDCLLERKICIALKNHAHKIDLDEHIWLRDQLFSCMKSGVLDQSDDCKQLYDKCHAKQEEIKLQKQFALFECNELPIELVNFIVCEYF